MLGTEETTSEEYSGMTEDMVEEFTEAFNLFDKDKDGKISVKGNVRIEGALLGKERAFKLTTLKLDVDFTNIIKYWFGHQDLTTAETEELLNLSKTGSQSTEPINEEATVSLREFLTIMGKKVYEAELKEELAKEKQNVIRDLFHTMDTDRDGFIDEKDMSHILRSYVGEVLSDRDIRGIMDSVSKVDKGGIKIEDESGQGSNDEKKRVISFNEFAAFMTGVL